MTDQDDLVVQALIVAPDVWERLKANPAVVQADLTQRHQAPSGVPVIVSQSLAPGQVWKSYIPMNRGL